MTTLIHNARILTPFSQQDGAVMIQGDRIVEVSRRTEIPHDVRGIDAKNLYLVPGFIDIHAHGGGGCHVMDGKCESIATMARAHCLEGTTTLLPTTKAAPWEHILSALGAVHEATRRVKDTTIAGAHMQGPFLSPARVDGKPALLQPGDADWEGLLAQGGIRMMGLAPELPGAFALAEALREREIVASISHSDANYEQVLNAVGHGFSDVSNAFTNCSTLRVQGKYRMPGVTECALTMDDLTMQVVADGKQLPMMLLQIILRCKGPENIILVSGAEAETGTPLAQSVRNMVAAGASLRVALRMATVNPARRIGLDQTKGRIAQGYDADLLLLDDSLNVRFVMAGGKVFRNELDDMP